MYLVGGSDALFDGVPDAVAGTKAMLVYRAKPGTDERIPAAGEDGAWTALPPTPLARGSSAARVLLGRLYSFSEDGNYLHRADIVEGGMLSGWQPFKNDFLLAQPNYVSLYGSPEDGFCTASVSLPDKKSAFIIGGINRKPGPGKPSVFPYISQVDIPVDNPMPVNNLLFWRSNGSLPEGRTEHACVGAKGRIFVLGGADWGKSGENAVFDTVLTASHDTGFVQWTEAGRLPFPNRGLLAVVLGERLYAIGGQQNVIYSAPILPDGRLGAFIRETSFPGSEFKAPVLQAIAYEGRIYLVNRSGGVFSFTPANEGSGSAIRNERFLPASLDGGFSLA
ncbi:MAG: hypothetical protein AAB037_06550, partial [Chloroflexota bacterium]